MTEVVLKNSKTDYIQLHAVKPSHYFLCDGKLYCKMSNDVESRGVFSIYSGIRISLDRFTQVKLVGKFEVNILE